MNSFLDEPAGPSGLNSSPNRESNGYEETARLANEAFPGGNFRAEHLRWVYERCFSQGGTVVSLRADGTKVGQFAMLRQTVNAHGTPEPAVQLVDLFILKKYRWREALAELYDEVARQCQAQGIRFAIGMPNERAIGADAFFFGLKPHLWLDIRVGLAVRGLLSPALLINAPYARDQVKYYTQWLEAFEPPPDENGVAWRRKKSAKDSIPPDINTACTWWRIYS